MALPLTGAEWQDTYGFNPLGIRKGIITNVLIRDYHGALTSLRDPLVGVNADGLFTPYADDGLYRNDLLAVDFPGGQFYDFGALAESGVEITPDVKVEDVRIAQARRAQRWDITEEDDEIMFTYRESNPGVDLLRFDKPLINVPDSGAPGYSVSKPSESDLVERQVCALAEDGDHRFAYIFPRLSRKKVGKTAINKKDPDDLELTYGALICPYADTPVYIVREGSGWRSLAGAPLFKVAPAAVLTGADVALSFTTPTIDDPPPNVFTYTVEQKTGLTWAPATVGAPAVAGATVTLTVTGLLPATSYSFRVAATSDSGMVGTSPESNSVTTP